jgi:orotidine-5'-phosphate decarboxylase
MSARDAGSFLDLLEPVRHANSSHLCVGLDPEPAALPAGLYGAEGVAAFCLAVVESTKDLVCAYKPNLAFFERLGAPGWEALGRVVAAIPSHIPIIADAKRGDIGTTSKAYAEALFEVLGAHACTLNPYLGVEALAPFLERDGAFSFILCRTSNPGSGALQNLDVGGEPLCAHVMRLFSPWIEGRRAGLVIGAQEAAAFDWAARLVPEATVLVPGIGTQGGTVEALAMALTPAQAARVVVSVSRAIIHAGSGEDFAVAARRAAIGYRDALRAALATAGSKRAAV